ncbi:protein jag [Pseudolysinimonas sp.]|jgi:spoIIIJ-associated protein|uniref:protein jag n=1 Tax=Pseudolysinimonas sp. TaxID=2680009 RepID=UPI0037851ED8
MSDTTETPTVDEAEAVVESEGATEDAAQGELSEQDVIDEGDAAADYIEELLDIADIDGDIDIDARGGRAYLSVSATGDSNLRLLSKPDTVAALQELTRLAVQNKTSRFSRLILDIGGSRDARATELATLVDHAITRLEGGAATASLPPMSSYERKVVHDIVAERGYTSESEGEGRDRHTVITARAGA